MTDNTVEQNASILMIRALFLKHLTAFGDDGLGKHGTNHWPKTFKATDVNVYLMDDDEVEKDDTMGRLVIELEGYSSRDCGHIMTDKNFELSMRMFMIEQNINPACVKWAPLQEQGDNYVTLIVDIGMLLEW